MELTNQCQCWNGVICNPHWFHDFPTLIFISMHIMPSILRNVAAEADEATGDNDMPGAYGCSFLRNFLHAKSRLFVSICHRDSQNKSRHMHTAAPEDKEINKMHREISNDTLNHQNYTMMVCNTTRNFSCH